MGRIWEVEDRESVEQEIAAIDAGIAAHVDYYLVSLKFPFGVGQFAGRDTAVVDDVMVCGGFLYELALEREGRCRSENGAAACKFQPSGRSNVVEAPGLGCNIVGPVTRTNVPACTCFLSSPVYRRRWSPSLSPARQPGRSKRY